ncbi:MAG: 4Fe-4S binding protein [Pseudomonadota bacterium]|nr:MAG: 4Fe-4S dicluster domain-containing protein [Desulfobacteraceae bacterium]
MAISFDDIPGVEWEPGAGEFITVDPELCIGCANCVKVCLGGCYEIVRKKAVIRSLDKCMECGACWYVCDNEAISFSWPPGGTGFRTKWG